MRKIFSSTFWTKVGVVLFVGVFLLGTSSTEAATSAKIVQEDITTTIAVFAVELGSVKDFKTKMLITCVDKDGKETKEPGSQVSTTEKFIVACKGLNTGSLYSYTIYPEDNSFFSKLTGTFTTKTAPVTTTTIDPDDTTKPPASNGYGCVSTDTSAYCMLAPLPIPDANGNIDPTGKINVKEGVGIYIESIIKLVIGIIGVLAVLMIVIGGIEYMSTISLGEKEGAKSRIMNALFGLLLALGSYILLNTINPALTDVSVNITGVDLGGEGPITDTDGTIPTTVTPPTNITIVTGSAQKLAEDILKNSKITFQADQKGDSRSSPQQNIIDTSKNLLAWTSARSDVGSKQVALSAEMLSGLIAASDASSSPISVSEILGGDHSADSRHYLGVAFDISARATDLPRVKAIGGACKLAGATELLGPCDSYPKDANGKNITGLCKATGFNTRADHWNHVHCGWAR